MLINQYITNMTIASWLNHRSTLVAAGQLFYGCLYVVIKDNHPLRERTGLLWSLRQYRKHHIEMHR